MTVGGSAGFGDGAWPSAMPGDRATTPAALRRVRRDRMTDIDVLRARGAARNRSLLYHFHAAAAPRVPARPIAEVREQRPRADLGLRPVREDLQLAALEPRGEIDGQRVLSPAPPEAIAQHQRVADIYGRGQRDEQGERPAKEEAIAVHGDASGCKTSIAQPTSMC